MRSTESEDRRPILGVFTVALTFLGLAFWTWRKCPDILVDFGRELYVPWQLAAGKVLYKDLAYFNGPLSPYLNALWFQIFGVSLTTIFICNLAILAVTTAMIYGLFAEACDRLTGAVCCLVFLCVFGFGQLVEIGNYNFVSPYSHELTHGIALSIGMILCLRAYWQKRQAVMAFTAGLLLGFVFLTKVEVFVAAFAAAVTLVAICARQSGALRRVVGHGLVGAAGMLSAIGLFVAILGRRMDVVDALHAVTASWTSLFASDVTSNIFYRRNLGLDEPVARLVIMGRAFIAVVCIVLAAAAADAIPQLRSRTKSLAIGASITLIVLSCLAKQSTNPWQDTVWPPVPWILVGASLPLVCVSLGATLISGIRRKTTQTPGLIPIAMWTVFAFVLLGKILLSARVYHYGFALAMPATLVLVASVLHFVPDALRRINGGGSAFRRFALAMLIADTLFFLKVSYTHYGAKTVVVGSGGDSIMTAPPEVDPRGAGIQRVLSRIEVSIPKNATFIVLPEGIMLNYLSRRTNPTPYINFMPLEMTIFGEAKMLAAIQRHAPDFILLAPKDTSEYGAGTFGADRGYGMQMMKWVNENYSADPVTESEASSKTQFQIRILKRNAMVRLTSPAGSGLRRSPTR